MIGRLGTAVKKGNECYYFLVKLEGRHYIHEESQFHLVLNEPGEEKHGTLSIAFSSSITFFE